MSAFKSISLVALLIIAVILIFAATKPDEFRVERSITIKAPAEKIFPLMNDLHSFGQWSPYEKVDPAMKRTYSGPQSGKGAVYAWEGNDSIGHGRMEIVESTPPSLVTIKLDFFKPFEAHNTAEFKLQPSAEGTVVTWAMFGPAPYMSKVMTVFFSMDKMVGGQFEEGLNNLKALVEK
ncbi:MAG TPA: SRPBCC family protein [Rhodocyclaceae bacterium]|nr:SRPBCC family protein [Rhodocyclaceae bacterium]